MFLLKPKQRSDEILPPPPPFEEEELDKRLEEKPKFFDKILKPKTNVETFPEEGELSELLEDLNNEPKKTPMKKKKHALKKEPTDKNPAIPKNSEPTQPKKAQVNQAKEKKAKNGKKIAEKPEIEPDDFGIGDIKFYMPEKPGKASKKDVLLPDTLEEFDIGDIGTDLGKDYNFEKDFWQETKTKPKELQEAEDEIKSAIEKIKGKGKTSFFHKLFGKKEKTDKEPVGQQLLPGFQEVSEGSEVYVIKDNIAQTREALMRFDLESAKKNYIEIMKLYNKISPEEKAEVYNDIKELYFERKSAEELKV